MTIEPVHCVNKDDLDRLAATMRQAAINDPDKIDEYKASGTEAEANSNAAEIGPDIIESGLCRLLVLYPKGVHSSIRVPVVVTFTLKDDGKQQEWNLSMSIPGAHGPGRVPDEIAIIIVLAFMQGEAEEVESKAYWKTVRHFVKPALVLKPPMPRPDADPNEYAGYPPGITPKDIAELFKGNKSK